eukprot:g27545.t1
MALPVTAAKDFISGPRVAQAARKLLDSCPLPQLCEALATASAEDAEPLVSALEGLSEIEEVRALSLQPLPVAQWPLFKTKSSAQLRLTVAKLLAHLASGGEASVGRLLDAGLFNLCEPLLLDEETGVAETAAKAVRAGVAVPPGQQALVASSGSLTEVLLRRLPELPDVQRIRVLALFVQLGRVAEIFPLLEQQGAFEKVLGSFLTDDLLLKLNAVELMDALGPQILSLDAELTEAIYEKQTNSNSKAALSPATMEKLGSKVGPHIEMLNAKLISLRDIRIPTSRTSKAESTVVSEFDSECGTMYADTVITWDSPADVGNVQDVMKWWFANVCSLSYPFLLYSQSAEPIQSLATCDDCQEFLARSNVPQKLEADLLDPYCDGSVRLCVTRLLGFIAGRSAAAAEQLLRSHEAPFPQSIAGLLDSRDVAARLCAIHAWATAMLQTKGLGFFLRWKPMLQEMVSLISATQNEIAKGAMDAWAIVLEVRAPEDQDATCLDCRCEEQSQLGMRFTMGFTKAVAKEAPESYKQYYLKYDELKELVATLARQEPERRSRLMTLGW